MFIGYAQFFNQDTNQCDDVTWVSIPESSNGIRIADFCELGLLVQNWQAGVSDPG